MDALPGPGAKGQRTLQPPSDMLPGDVVASGLASPSSLCLAASPGTGPTSLAWSVTQPMTQGPCLVTLGQSL